MDQNWLDKLKKFIQDLGWRMAAGFLLIIAGIILPLVNPVPEVLKNKFPIIVWCMPWLLIFCGIWFLVLVFVQRKKRGLQLIAWNGFNEREVRSPYKKSRLDVLEYVRGIEKVTHLKYEGSLFDVLIADVEFLKRHDIGRKLLPLTGTNYEPLWNNIPLSLRMAISERGNNLGIPIRCGLNAIIINKDMAREIFKGNTITSYKDLQLSKILSECTDKRRIGLWNWYLPTLSILLLTEGKPLNENLWGLPNLENDLRRITDSIVDNNNKEKFLLLNDPKNATDHLIEKDVWIILGGAGWLMPLESSRRKNLEVIIPTEGAIMWVECASIIRNPEGNETLSRSLIEYLLESTTQIQLAQRRAYRTCPVTIEAFQSLPAHMGDVVDFHRIFDANYNLQPYITLRNLPDNWRTWEHYWENVERNVKQV